MAIRVVTQKLNIHAMWNKVTKDMKEVLFMVFSKEFSKSELVALEVGILVVFNSLSVICPNIRRNAEKSYEVGR